MRINHRPLKGANAYQGGLMKKVERKAIEKKDEDFDFEIDSVSKEGC